MIDLGKRTGERGRESAGTGGRCWEGVAGEVDVGEVDVGEGVVEEEMAVLGEEEAPQFDT